MHYLVALLAALTVTLTPKKLTEPGIVKSVAGDYTFENPKSYAVELTLNCGADWEPLVLCLDPGPLALRIVQPDGRDAICTVDSWKRERLPNPNRPPFCGPVLP